MKKLSKVVLIICLSVLGWLLLTSSVWATTYYISPIGTDGACTTINAPCKTFAYVIPLLVAGDTLILKNGTYTPSTTGMISISGMNGSPSAWYTIKAENERAAFLQSDGTAYPVYVTGSSYWSFEGLRAENVDYAADINHGHVIRVTSSNYINVMRCLMQYTNRYANSHLILLSYSTNCLVEECEGYNFHRHGIDIKNSDNNTVRRCYFNSRGRADIPGGYGPTHDPNRGDTAVSVYPGSYNLIENIISEGNCAAVDVQPVAISTGNKFYGVISLNDDYGTKISARGSTHDSMPENTIVTDLAVINALYCSYFRGNRNTYITNASFIGGGGGLYADYSSSTPGDGNYSVYADSVLAINATGTGIRFQDQDTWLVDYPNSYANGTNFYPAATDPSITHELTVDPLLGSCLCWLPAASPMKGTGKGGADIGANILYQYLNGNLTTTPLWNTSTNGFSGCGTTVAGVNDVTGSSCSNVHLRLQVGVSNGCAFPTGYGGTDPDYYTLTYPNGGQTLTIGVNQTIRWTSSGSPGAVKIELYRNTAYETLTASTADTGEYVWAVAGAAATDAKIRLTDVATGLVTDSSDAVFTITAAASGTITVTSPSAGSIYVIGSIIPIMSTFVDVSGHVMVEFSRDGGTTYKIILPDIPYTESRGWVAEGPTSSQCKIKVTSLDNLSVYGVSATFRIGAMYLLLGN